MKRRDFIKNTALLAAVAEVPVLANASVHAPQTAPQMPQAPEGKLIDTPPALMNYAETSMGITFGVSALANGFVTYGEKIGRAHV